MSGKRHAEKFRIDAVLKVSWISDMAVAIHHQVDQYHLCNSYPRLVQNYTFALHPVLRSLIIRLPLLKHLVEVDRIGINRAYLSKPAHKCHLIQDFTFSFIVLNINLPREKLGFR